MIDWNKVSFVVSGKRRTSIVLSLLKKSKTIEELIGELKVSKTNLLVALRGLMKEGIVSFERKEKIYKLTKIGKEIAKNLKRNQKYFDFI